MKPNKASLILLLTAFVWGSGFLVSQICLDEGISPIQLIAGRFIVACLFLDILLFKKILKLNKDIIFAGSVIGVFLIGGFVFQNYGLKYSTPSVCAFVTSVYVVLVPFIDWVKDKRRPDMFTLLGCVLAMVGVGLFSVTESLTISIGAVFTFVCAIFYAFQVSGIGYYTKKHDPVMLTVVTLNFTALAATLVVLVGSLVSGAFPVTSFVGLGSLVYLGLFCTAICFLGQNIGQKYTSAAQAAVLISTESVFGSFFSMAFYKEMLTPRMIIGGIIIFLAVMMSETKGFTMFCVREAD